ncbi:hypothetical protein RJT34_27542 [Clitoria ternatea]|uniref:FCP1 homology domain-containing protein n=1 Tax=Clitoria ternatea TaxID=43366 RepID=A0AAN9IB19_CLITE
MPSPKMKAKSTTTCKKDGSYLHMSPKSNGISKKIPCSIIRLPHEKEDLATSPQTSQNCFSKDEESFKDHDCGNHMEQTCFTFNGCTGSIEERDYLPTSLSSCSESMLSCFERPNYANCHQFDEVNREQITWEPQVDNNNFTNIQMPDVLDSYAYEGSRTGFTPNDGISVFDDSRDFDALPDLEFAGTNYINDVIERVMIFPPVQETVEVVNFNYGGSCEEFQETPDSWFHMVCHQANPFTEENVFNSCQFDSDRVDYFDPDTFVQNFLEFSDESNTLPALVSKEASKRKNVTLVLDLDETLIHSTMEQCDDADFTFQVSIVDKEYTVYVRKRPFLQEFLEKVSEMFEVIIFTASKRPYAEKLLDVLDPDKKFFSGRVYRESCIVKDGTYTKDLTVLGIDLAKLVIVDNSPKVFRLQVNNGIPIESWFQDRSDTALISLLPFLEKLVDVEDVRPIVAEKFGARN